MDWSFKADTNKTSGIRFRRLAVRAAQKLTDLAQSANIIRSAAILPRSRRVVLNPVRARMIYLETRDDWFE
jgi:hypothetical protein